MALPVDLLPAQESHLDLTNKSLPSDFGLDDYTLTDIMDDVILVEYCDIVGDEASSDHIERGGILIPTSSVQNAWRKGRVILIGPRVQQSKVGDIVIFPNSMGIPITNLEITDHGKIKNGLFINEQRIFGICKEA